MNAAALLGIKAELGKLRHKGALTTEQFQLLKTRTKDGAVTESLLGVLNQAWTLRCDGTLDEGEYAEDIENAISEMPPPSRSSTAAASALASQAQSAPPAAPLHAAAASKAEKRKSSALAKAAEGSPNIQLDVERWESNKLTALDRRVLITQWVGEAAKQIDSDIRYHRRLFEKTGLAMTADGSDDNLINLEGVEQGTYSFMDVDTTPKPLEDVLSIPPAPADEENPPGSSDESESESESEEEGVKSGEGTRPRQDVDELATMDTDDDVTDYEVLLPLETPAGYSLVSTAPAALTRALVHQEILLRLGMGWFRGVITRKARARTSERYDSKVFLETDGSTRSLKLPLAKYSVNGAAAEGSWALLSRCADNDSVEDSESEDENEFANVVQESGGGGVDGNIESAGGGVSSTR